MIPVKLSMRNFMCYRDNVPSLSFEGIHLACLSGDNGNGKSAVIDAITWALWGKTRAGSDDELINTNQPEMEVEFEFDMGEQRYRILRKRTRPKKRTAAGQSSLELQISDGDGFRAITGNTIAQTQQAIIDTLHMDYDTFVNSAYLRQGHADEFTRQAPAKRKEVLGNILGLSVYDELEERARELARKGESDTEMLERNIAEISAELAQKPVYETELETAQQELAGIDAAVGEKEAALNEIRQKNEVMGSKKAQLDEIDTRLAGSTLDLQRWDEQAEQHRRRIGEYEEIIGRREDIESGFARFTAAREADDELDIKFRQSVILERQKNQLEEAVREAGQSLNTEHTVVRRDIGQLESKTQQLPELKNQLTQAQAELRRMGESDKTLEEKSSAIEELQRQITHLEADIGRLGREITEAGEKLDLIASHLESHTEARCPLCNSELGSEGLKVIEETYTKEKQEKTELLAKHQAEIAGKRSELEALQRDKTQLETGLNQEKSAVQGRITVLTGRIADTEAEDKKLAGLRETLQEIEQRLVKKDFAVNEQNSLVEIEKELAGLDYDAARHEEVRRQHEALKTYEGDKNRLDEAEKRIEAEREAAARAEEAVKGIEENLKLDRQKKESLAAELVQLPELANELAAAESVYRELTARRSRAQEAVGSIKAKIERCDQLETRKKEKEAELAQSSREQTIYRELVRAFGKTGIQALLIEAALPEIETEANRLLSRLTDGRMTVKFDTQRETKRGTVQETLDINIDDGTGTRNYEMFSGGEAFRINFAIRIALSRLLAKRAGAPLPTLIIDEGFGTQDSTGLEKLKEAINSIQDDFQRILVITHMEELKDAFPVRIDIIRNAGGSTISVN